MKWLIGAAAAFALYMIFKKPAVPAYPPGYQPTPGSDQGV